MCFQGSAHFPHFEALHIIMSLHVQIIQHSSIYSECSFSICVIWLNNSKINQFIGHIINHRHWSLVRICLKFLSHNVYLFSEIRIQNLGTLKSRLLSRGLIYCPLKSMVAFPLISVDAVIRPVHSVMKPENISTSRKDLPQLCLRL